MEHWGCRVLIPNGKFAETTVSGQTLTLVNGRGNIALLIGYYYHIGRVLVSY